MSIVSEIKARGADAVREYAVQFDGVEPARATPDDSDLPRDALLDLADRVRRWHEVQRPADIELEIEPGVTLQRRWVALDTVGVYVPRNLISTLVMCVVPAQVAGVRHIVVCTPPHGAGGSPPRRSCSASTRCGRSEARRRSGGSRTSNASTRSSGRGTSM